jgi:hypothetical protein
MESAYLVYRRISKDLIPIRICFDESIAKAAVGVLKKQYPRRKYEYDSVTRDPFPADLQIREFPR